MEPWDINEDLALLEDFTDGELTPAELEEAWERLKQILEDTE